jgi:hypothetical protein
VERAGRGAVIGDADAVGAVHQRQWRSAAGRAELERRRLHAQRHRKRAACRRLMREQERAVHEPIT